jgi:Zn-finger protein
MAIRLNRACKYFPCHKGLEDCTFCYCPYYPCLDERRGKFIYLKRGNKAIWSCADCNWIHKRRIVDKIFSQIRSGAAGPGSGLIFCRKNVGIIILAHGSKRESAKKSINGVIGAVRRRLGVRHVEPAYLQLCDPDLSKAAKALVKKGCRRIIVVPYFLFNGNHMAKDIPRAIARQRNDLKGIEFAVTRNLSQDEEALGAIVAQRIREASCETRYRGA